MNGCRRVDRRVGQTRHFAYLKLITANNRRVDRRVDRRVNRRVSQTLQERIQLYIRLNFHRRCLSLSSCSDHPWTKPSFETFLFSLAKANPPLASGLLPVIGTMATGSYLLASV